MILAGSSFNTQYCTRWHVCWWTWVGLTLILAVPPSAWICLGWWEIGRTGWAAGKDGGTSKIKVNPTQVRQQMCHPVQRASVSSAHYHISHGTFRRPSVSDNLCTVLVWGWPAASASRWRRRLWWDSWCTAHWPCCSFRRLRSPLLNWMMLKFPR